MTWNQKRHYRFLSRLEGDLARSQQQSLEFFQLQNRKRFLIMYGREVPRAVMEPGSPFHSWAGDSGDGVICDRDGVSPAELNYCSDALSDPS